MRGKESERLLNACKAEKVILERWNAIAMESVKSKSLRCTFVLQPMVAIFDNGNSTKLLKTIDTVLTENVWFSQLELFPSESRATPDKKLLTKLLSLVFGGFSPQHSQPPYRLLSSGNTDGSSQLQVVTLSCYTTESWVFGAVLSSLVLNGMTKNVSVRLDCVHSGEDHIARNKWLWLAYGAFSKRARALDTLTLLDVDCMTAGDIEAFASVVDSDHPEEVLCGCPHGRVDERVATLASGAKIRWELDAQGQPRRKSRPLSLSSAMKSVWIFCDDGSDELVNAVVPGFGRCLNEDDDENEDDDDEDDGEREMHVNHDGLVTFIEKIGSSLKNLTLDGPRTDVDENMILRCCPKLETLSLCLGFVAVQLDLKNYRTFLRQIPELNSHWDDVTAFAAGLSNQLNPIAKCTRRLRVTLNKQWSPPDFEANAEKLMQMLEKNTRLEYLEVIGPIEHEDYADRFSKYYLKPIKNSPVLFLGSIAFLSVISWLGQVQEPKKKKKEMTKPGASLCKLNQHVLSNIFMFAGERKFREVYFHSQDGGIDWDSEDEDWFARLG
ncbi:hypothetical protein V7S43_004145 [Phytophthora oleae]|uniref:Uncharacterized protein n=1 Tax=Phytophthora oleae TaxID=2107226 RepID=A0ABD3FYY0_9STRA